MIAHLSLLGHLSFAAQPLKLIGAVEVLLLRLRLLHHLLLADNEEA